MFFHALTFARSRGSCLNTRPLGQAFKHRQRDLASVNAMKQTCVIVILAYFTWFQPKRSEKVAKSSKYPLSYIGFLQTKWCERQTFESHKVITKSYFGNKSIGEMISQGHNAFRCNVMQKIRSQIGFVKLKLCSNSTWISWFEHGFLWLQTDSYARIYKLVINPFDNQVRHIK